jgi:hypothetical protein
MAIDRTSNTRIIGFLEVGNRSIIPIGYKDAPQYRSIEPQTLKLLGSEAQYNYMPVKYMILLLAASAYLIFATVTIKAISHLLNQWEQNHQGDENRWDYNDRGRKTLFNIDMSAGSTFTLTFANIFVINIFLSAFIRSIVDSLADRFLAPLPINASGSLIMIRGNNLTVLHLTSIWLFQLIYILPLYRYFYMRNQRERVRQTAMVYISTVLITAPLFVVSIHNLFSHFKRI